MIRRIVLALVALALCSPARSQAVDMPVEGKKLILKRSGSGVEKLVWIVKDPTFLFPALGGGDDPSVAGAELAIFSEAEPAGVTFMMPAGLGKPGWKTKDAAVDLYKFVNPEAPTGISEVKVLVMKDTKLIKVVGKDLGLALAAAQGQVLIRLTTGSIRNCALFAPGNGTTIKKDEVDKFIAKGSTATGFVDCGGLPSTTTSTSSTSTSTSGPTTTTSTTLFDWGLSCFPTTDCGATFCPANSLQCTDFIESVGLVTGSEMCFFDCMDGTGSGMFMDVTDCRDGCGGSAAPACDMTVAGGGGFDGDVTGPGACTPSGFAATVTYGGGASTLSRVWVDFGTAIDESSLFLTAPLACDGSCTGPGSGSACDIGAPHTGVPLDSRFRLQIGTPGLAPEVCDRSGVPTTVCSYSSTGYTFTFDLPPTTAGGIDLTGAPIDVTLFISCHVESSGGGSFLHFSSGDFYATGTF